MPDDPRPIAAFPDQERLAQALLDAAPTALYVFDLIERRPLFVSPRGLELLRKSDPDVRGLGADFLPRTMHPDDWPRAAAYFRDLATAADGEAWEFEYRMRATDGAWRWFRSRDVVFARDPDGRPRQILGLALDITERKWMEEALRDSERRFRSSVQTMLDAFGIYSSVRDEAGAIVDFRIEYINDAACAVNRLPREAQVGKLLCELLPAHRTSGLFEEYRRLVETGEPLRKELLDYEDDYGGQRLRRAFDIQAARLGDGFAASWRDVTERKRAEDALHESEARFRTMADTTPVIIWATDAAGGIEFVNRAYRDFFGVTEEQVRGPNWQPLVHPDDAEAYVGAFLAALREGTPFHAEARVRRADGAWRWIESFGRPRRSPSGDRLGMVGSSPDITERKQAEAALQMSEQRLRLSLEAAQAGTFDIDLTRDVPPVVTEEVKRLFGFALDASPLVEDYVQRVHPEDRDRVVSAIRTSADRAVGHDVEYRVVRPNGEVVWLASRADVVHDDEGRAARLIGVLIDITERRTAQQRQQEFIEAVSHDLKNPLASVRAQAQLLRRRATQGRLAPDALPDALALIEGATGRMAAQIDELQDAARLRAGHPLELRTEPVDLAELTKTAVAEAQGAATRHAVRLEAPGRGPVGRWDALRLRRVIDNLLSNAIKYSDGGEVVVAVREERRGTARWALLSVRDEGVGIPAADLPHVFERYRRGSNVGRRRQGSGVGLAGARQIVEQHGGTIAVESAEGRGSTFTVELPLDRTAAPNR